MSESRALTVASKLQEPKYRERFKEVLGKKAAGFMSSIISATNMNRQLQECDADSVLASAMIAATLDLPINQSLGFAHIVPYGGNAQFQIGWKGLNQLALRSGQMYRMNASEIYEGELQKWDRVTGEFEYDPEMKTSDTIVGYVSYFQLTNGYEHYLYMKKDEIIAHAIKYSRSYSNPKAPWKTQFDAMALKTVHKLNVSKWAPMTPDMELALRADQGVMRNLEDEIDYPDNPSTGLNNDDIAPLTQGQHPFFGNDGPAKVAEEPPEKPKRHRRTKAEMKAAREAKAAENPEPISPSEPPQNPSPATNEADSFPSVARVLPAQMEIIRKKLNDAQITDVKTQMELACRAAGIELTGSFDSWTFEAGYAAVINIGKEIQLYLDSKKVRE